MIRKFIFGQPMETGAVVQDMPACTEKPEAAGIRETEESVVLSCMMENDDIVYGLGEQVRGMNKRGFTYISDAADDPVHTEDKQSLYGAHNFMILTGSKTFGVFVDNPGKVVFDIGDTQMDTLTITSGKDCVFYVIEGDNLKDIVKQFRQLVGRSYIAPKWAFGYQQSRWGYECEDDIRKVVKGHHGNNIPLESVYLDIDYMERYKDFTVDAERFPAFPEFVDEMKEQNVHLVPIIDAGVKIEKDYPVYEEGVANNYFCKDADGNDFVAAVWPGRVHLPDMLNPEAREWFGNKYQWLIDQGIDGFWNDMNEPAIFYSDKRLKEVMDEVAGMREMNLDIHSFFHMKDIVQGLSNSDEDYAAFYHNIDGEKIQHLKVHNLYGFNMTKAAGEAFDRIEPDKRILMFSRSSYIGMHRYGGIWTGDNCSWWQHLLLSIQQMPSLNMCGILYTGSDIGGFGCHTTEDLMLRWLEFAVFTPLMRNHSAAGTREQEVYQFTHLDNFRNIIRIRYGLLPYIYSEYMKAALNDEMYFRPLAFDYPQDKQAANVDDQLLVGDSLMIAPVYKQNAKGRYVYLPEDMLMVRMSALENRTYEVMSKGHHYIDIALNEMVVFVRKNHVLPLAKLGENVLTTNDIDESSYEWLGYVTDKAEYTLYTDDGISKAYTPETEWKKFSYTAEDFAGKYSL